MDFIITWVDGNDPEWQKQYFKYKQGDSMSTHAARFRDWDNLQYWFRGVERFAPWVDQIHFVTWGHLPEWLNTKHPKLNIVEHKDYIPEKYLPTFNSHTIELNFHRIEELSNEYVYFNSDTFLIDETKEKDFFVNGKPCEMPLFKPITGWKFNIILLRNISVLNKHFSLHHSIKQNPLNWFNLKYGKRNSMRNFLFYLASRVKFTGFQNFHLPLSGRKETLRLIWEEEPQVMEESSINKFRNYTTVNPYLQRYWEMASNNFCPIDKRKLGKVFEFRVAPVANAVAFIKNKEKPIVCVNDHPVMEDFEESKAKIIEAFDEILPQKSSFEL